MHVTRRVVIFAVAIAPAPVWSDLAHARKAEIYTGFLGGTAIGGYDAVSYFREGRPVEGSRSFSTVWKGATWRFSSEANLSAFKANPQAYAPQFGGYCAWAVSEGYTAKGDPHHWKIVDGKLYLNYNARVQRDWERDPAGHIAKGNGNWPAVLNK